MFSKETYQNRREQLRKNVKGGIILLLGNVDVPMNYKSNTYRFRQDSSFLYFFGIDHQGMAGILDVDGGEDVLFGDDVSLEDIIWMGPQPRISEKAARVGVTNSAPYARLFEAVAEAKKAGRPIHFLPPYRGENKILLEQLLGIKPQDQAGAASVELIRAVVALRSVKEDQEIAEIEKAAETAWLMHTTAMKMARPGVYEYQISGQMEGIASAGGGMHSFPIILTIHGETLHNHYHGHQLQKGNLLLVDAGAENAMHYATDHTRTMPVGGAFTPRQKEIYQIVLDAQVQAIQAIKPDVPFRDIHLLAAEVIGNGLKGLGLMKGDIPSAVAQGAHALFMPHGLGHMMGLDVHDMEDLGENYVGYDDEIKRSELFGTRFLRLGRRLKQGFVVTVEPGIYFIPALVEKWEADGKFTEFINYGRVKEYLDFGGVRLEDDILVTDNGFRNLGRPIPKTIEEIEALH
ncbi:MAG: aminopeptidase P family protein [Bacteroidales bacterium]